MPKQKEDLPFINFSYIKGKRRTYIGFWLICFFFSSIIQAQTPVLKFKHISNEEGLSNSTIECIYQDHRGFIWFGTRDGLNRYDGYQITTYKNIFNDAKSLSDNYIRSIYEDQEQNLWIGTSNGLNRFDAVKNNFKRYQTLKNNSNNNNHIINSIIEDKSGKLWIGTAGSGLFSLDRKNDRFSPFIIRSGNQFSENQYINQLLEDKYGSFWIATNEGLKIFDQNQKTFLPIPILSKYKILTITSADDHDLWLGTEEAGLVLYNSKNSSIKAYQHQNKKAGSVGSDQIRAVCYDHENNLWAGGVNAGLNLLNKSTDSFYHYEYEPDNPNSLSQRTISALFEDRQGNLWIGTHRGGVNVYSPKSEKFKLYRQKTNNSLSYNDVKAFCEGNDDDIWIGTDGGGLNNFNRKTHTFKSYRYNPFNLQSLGSDAVLHILENQNQLYIGTWGGGLNIFNPKTKLFTRYLANTNKPGSISSNYVQKTYKDSNGNFWVCTYYGGLNLFNPQTKTFTRVVFGHNRETQIMGNNIVSIIEDKMGRIWIGTDDGGLNCYHPSTKTFSHYFINEPKKPDLRVLFIDHIGRLWVGQRGLYLFNEEKNSFSLYTDTAGLGEEFIDGITEDKTGNFWISTSNWITRFNPKTKDFKKYNTADGLQGLEFESNAYLQTKDGEHFFGGINGFNTFYPDQIKKNNYSPPVFITGLQIFNQNIEPNTKDSPLSKDISFTKEIYLNYEQSTLTFSFAALNFIAPENNKYAYQLKGFDPGFNYVGTNRKASYTNLGPGTYTFQVKAANNDGKWNNKGTSLIIHISPPFWETWWFRLIVFLIVTYIVYVILSYRRTLEIKGIEEKKKEEIHQVQLQFFTNISHEFRTPLTLILGPIERLIKEQKDQALANYYRSIYRNANRLMGLINELMDFRKVESGALKLKVIPGNLNLFVDEIAEEFESLAEEKKISFKLNKGKDFAQVWFDRHILEKIILNLVHNAFKYTPEGGKISLSLLSENEQNNPSFTNKLEVNSSYKALSYAYIVVRDNGIGISANSIKHLFERYFRITDSHLGSGVGLAFVKSLTLIHKGNILVSSEKNEGTEITIAIPVQKEDFLEHEQWMQSKDEGVMSLESLQYNQDDTLLDSPPKRISKIINHSNHQHLLIVDDNEELRTFLRESLGDDYQISEAKDGLSGIEKAKEVAPDLIISDVMMPVMNGIEFCKAIKENIDTSHIPFLMLTAKDSIPAEIEGISSGADFYFTKPVSITLLQLTLKNIFAQKQKILDYHAQDQYSSLKDLAHSEKDKQFIGRLINIIESQLVNPDMDIEYLCLEIGMSRTKLYQKIKSISGQFIGEFVRTIRLKKAVEIMTREDVLLTDVMYRVGIQTQSYFGKAFKKAYGKTPTQYLQELEKKKC